jgi:hypothetical protein
MLLGLIRRRAEWKAAIAADARRLIESFNDHAYFEAAASMARAQLAIGPPSSSKLPGGKGSRSASPVLTRGRNLRGIRGSASSDR